MKRTAIALLTAITVACTVHAAVIDDAIAKIKDGKYTQAVEMLKPVLKKTPRDARANYWNGMALLGSGEREKGLRALNTAAERGYTDAYAALVADALENYEATEATDLIADWRTALKKAKKAVPAELENAESRAVKMANMMDRVEAVPVIAVYSIDATTFMDGLDALSNPTLPSGNLFIGTDNAPFFVNNSGREVFWTQPDSTGINRLYTAGVLDDGTRDQPQELTPYVGQGDIRAPFVTEDGETLYFAAKRHDSLGGYDLYMTRRDGDGGFYEPTNIGMPFNTPGDDLLYVLDETAAIGWWATRKPDTDTVDIMVFVPNKERITYDTERDDLAALASTADPALTIPEGFNTEAARARIPVPATTMQQRKDPDVQPLRLSLGNGRIVDSPSQLRNRQAAAQLQQVLELRGRVDGLNAQLKDMRSRYAAGNKNLTGDIRAAEAQLDNLKTQLREATNLVIRLESN